MPLIADALVKTVIGCAIEVHRSLGPGLLESVYQRCLAHEFGLERLNVVRQMPLPIRYKGVDLDCGYRIDFLVEGRLVLELKTVDSLLPIHQAQVLTYLKRLNVKQGLLINFNTTKVVDGLRSVVL